MMFANSYIGAIALSTQIILTQAATNSTPEALNPQLTNTVPQAPSGPILYFVALLEANKLMLTVW